MRSFKCVVQSPQGLHALSIMRLVREAQKCSCVITVEYAGRRANARNVMELMKLRAVQGAELTFITEGEGEETAAENLKALCTSFL